MATIQQQIEVAADPGHVRALWERFVHWAHQGPGRLVCDQISCVDAVRSGVVDIVPGGNGRTAVTVRVQHDGGGPSHDELRRELAHDLVVFKDYVERSGLARRRPTVAEKTMSDYQSGRSGDAPRHVRLSSEDDTTFWRSHFPT